MRRRVVPLASLALGVASAACSAVLGLDPPPGEGPDAGNGSDATTSSDSGVAPSPEAGPANCPALDAGDAGTYSPLAPIPIDDAGHTTWEFFNPSGDAGIPGFNAQPSYTGGAFDGRYVYFAGTSRWVARYDTQGGGFSDPSSWSGVFLPNGEDGFAGAVFDGRYVTLVPGHRNGSTAAVAARFDTLVPGGFIPATSAAWEYFDLSTLAADGGAPTYGFYGGVFDGRYIYFVPHFDGPAVNPFGRVVRYDTAGSLDAGLPGDAGDPPESGASTDAGREGGTGLDAATDSGAGAVATGFADPSLWTSFDVSTVNPAGVGAGFAGGVFAAGAVYLVPNQNGAYDGSVDFGLSGTAFRYATDAGFGTPSSWTSFDMTRVSGYANDFEGAAFDGRFVYFVPRGNGVVTRYDTTVSFASPGAWGSYDVTRTVPLIDAGAGQVSATYAGGAFDGRFVYFIPADTSGYGPYPVLRYDTLGSFSAPCAWSSFDPSQLPVPVGSHAGSVYAGAVFDGQYLYLVPNGSTGTVFVRFAAKAQAPSPNPPVFNNSFL